MNHPVQYDRLNQMLVRLGREAPGVMAGFSRMHDASQAEGALSAKAKELMALAIGITVHCEGCITYHVHDALAAGASPEEIAETVGVAVMMGGGPATVYGAEALEALDQFREGTS